MELDDFFPRCSSSGQTDPGHLLHTVLEESPFRQELQEVSEDQQAIFTLSPCTSMKCKMLVFNYSERATTKFGAADGQPAYQRFESLQLPIEQRVNDETLKHSQTFIKGDVSFH